VVSPSRLQLRTVTRTRFSVRPILTSSFAWSQQDTMSDLFANNRWVIFLSLGRWLSPPAVYALLVPASRKVEPFCNISLGFFLHLDGHHQSTALLGERRD
jgi:hypothetical protein